MSTLATQKSMSLLTGDSEAEDLNFKACCYPSITNYQVKTLVVKIGNLFQLPPPPPFFANSTIYLPKSFLPYGSALGHEQMCTMVMHYNYFTFFMAFS